MAETKISELPPVTTLDPSAIVPLVQGGITSSAMVSQIAVAGPVGPPGPQGDPGISQGQYPYKWKSATTVSDPLHGFIKANNADKTLITIVSSSVYTTADQAVIALRDLVVGDRFYLYQAGAVSTWNRYEITATPTNHTNEWFELPVVYVDTGDLAYNPGNNSNVDLVIPVTGQPGPAGPAGPPGPPGATVASGVAFTPTGAIGSTNVQSALAELDTEKQPVDSDLTAIAALSTTSFGRSLLASVDQAALRSAAGLGSLATLSTITTAEITDGTITNADVNPAAGIALGKLATDPLARANHTGTQLAATVSDFNTAVRTNRLDQMASPTASVAMSSQTITGLGTPTNATDAATKAYVDSTAQGLWATYTAQWLGATTAPSVGTGGTITGRYTVRGKMCTFNVTMQFGSSAINGGSGDLSLTLPVNAAVGVLGAMVGSAFLFVPNPGLLFVGVPFLTSATACIPVFPGSASQASSGRWCSTRTGSTTEGCPLISGLYNVQINGTFWVAGTYEMA